MLPVNFLSGCNSFTLKQIFSSRMVLPEGNHSEPEIGAKEQKRGQEQKFKI
jgi:hypothetical protein